MTQFHKYQIKITGSLIQPLKLPASKADVQFYLLPYSELFLLGCTIYTTNTSQQSKLSIEMTLFLLWQNELLLPNMPRERERAPSWQRSSSDNSRIPTPSFNELLEKAYSSSLAETGPLPIFSSKNKNKRKKRHRF